MIETYIKKLGSFAPTLRDPVLLTIERVIRFGCLLAGNVLAARYLGSESFGSIQVLLATVAMLLPLADCGLDVLSPREVGRNAGQGLRGIRYLVLTRLCLGASVGAIFLVVAAPLFAAKMPLWTMALFALPFCFRSLETLEPLAQMDNWLPRYVAVRATVALVGLAAKVVLLSSGHGLGAFLAVTGVEYALALFCCVVMARRARTPVPTGIPSHASIRTLLREGLPFALSGAASASYSRLDQLILAIFLGMGSVGVYGAAVQIISAWSIVPLVLHAALQPRLAQLTVGSDQYRRRIIQLYRLALGLGVFETAVTCLAAPFLVTTLFGESFGGARNAIFALSPILVFSFVGIVRTMQIVCEGNSNQHLYAGLLACAVNACLNLVLIPMFGLVGAACAASVAAGVAAIGSCFILPGLAGCKNVMLEAYFLRRPVR